MLTLWIIWSVLTLVVISLAIARKVVARKDDEYVHLADAELTAIPQQAALANKLDRLDSWGKNLTIVDVAFSILIVAILCYKAWQQSQIITN
jgi:hypothetical protein